jgi:hypothetical protein
MLILPPAFQPLGNRASPYAGQGARRFVVGDLLRVLDCTTVLQAGGDASGTEGITTGRVRQSGLPLAINAVALVDDRAEHLGARVWALEPTALG